MRDGVHTNGERTGRAPAVGSSEFRALVARWEERPWNRAGADKAWIDRLRDEPPSWVVRDELESPVARLLRTLARANVLHVVAGVGAADAHASRFGAAFRTRDLDLFLPCDAHNLLACWRACEDAGYALWSGGEPLDAPRDAFLARRVVAVRALTTARASDSVPIDLTLVLGDLDFEDVWLRRATGIVHGCDAPIARMSDIVASKRAADRAKDRAFLDEHGSLITRILDAEGPARERA